ncbi:MAG: hypothetical protein LCH70_11570, partial [Proteobacteria bacterium]|nr:hypothetical protein [Pseudomonadota bacterium]
MTAGNATEVEGAGRPTNGARPVPVRATSFLAKPSLPVLRRGSFPRLRWTVPKADGGGEGAKAAKVALIRP